MLPSLPGGLARPPGPSLPLIALAGVSKRFGAVIANREVSFAVSAGVKTRAGRSSFSASGAVMFTHGV